MRGLSKSAWFRFLGVLGDPASLFAIAVLNLAVLSGLEAFGGTLLAIVDDEPILDQGRVVLAELAPADPRSLMQADYMALRYAIDDELAAVSRTRLALLAPVARAYAYVAFDAEGRPASSAPATGCRPAGSAWRPRLCCLFLPTSTFPCRPVLAVRFFPWPRSAACCVPRRSKPRRRCPRSGPTSSA